MEEIITQIKETIEDGFLSNVEKKELRQVIEQKHLSHRDRINLILQAIFIAERKADENSYRAVFKWLKKVSNVLGNFTEEPLFNNAFFTHKHDIRKLVIEHLEAAETSLDICMFTISDDRIADAITRSFKKGVKTRIITDDEKVMDKGSDVFKLKHRGIRVKIDSEKSLMHHKFVIIDSDIVITGSYNWTRTGSEVNNENIIITDNDLIVQSFNEEYERLWKEMKDL